MRPAGEEVTARWPGLDLARLAVVAGLIPFHAALVFAADDDFYVKDDRTTDVLLPLAAPFVVWAMPLLFLVSGVGTWTAWQRAGGGAYVLRRLRRIAVPLVVGTVLLVPLPVWLRLRAGGASESYARFWPRFFRVRVDWSEFPFLLRPAAGGRGFETGHLWFLVLLLLYSLAAVPALLLLSGGRGAGRVDRLASAIGRAPVLLGALVVAAATAGLGLDEGIAAWNEVAYGLFFAAGVLLGADERLRAAVRRSVRPAGAGAVVALVAAGGLFLLRREVPGADPLLDTDPVSAVGRACYGMAGWCATLAIAGALLRVRPRRRPGRGTPSRLASYVPPAVLPWYVLHQPVVVAVAFVVVGWSLHPALAWVLIVAASVLLTLAVYDLLVRRWRPTRWLFGMR